MISLSKDTPLAPLKRGRYDLKIQVYPFSRRDEGMCNLLWLTNELQFDLWLTY